MLRYLRLMMFEKAIRALVGSGGRLNYAVFSCKRDGEVMSVEVLAERDIGNIWVGIRIPKVNVARLKRLKNLAERVLKKELVFANDMYWIKGGVEEAVVIIEEVFTRFYDLPENYEPVIEIHIDGVGDFIVDKSMTAKRADVLSINLLSYYNGKDMKRIKVTKDFFGNIRRDEVGNIRFKSGVLKASMEVYLRSGQVIRYVIPKRSVLEYKRKLIALGYKVEE
ncbi:MAG: hypothetical protein J7J20_01070 [Desulfurococcales archaeon]|nr:hypothetical protein [Desulfurococcales archaeon]